MDDLRYDFHQNLLEGDKHRVKAFPRYLTNKVSVGGVTIGGGDQIPVQSMCTTDTSDVKATLAQINELEEAGCEIIRVAIGADNVEAFGKICSRSSLPVVADVQFDYKLAIEAARRGASALRINPGNIGSYKKVDSIIEAAKKAHIPIRIGVNAGSLDKKIEEDPNPLLTHAQKLVLSAKNFVDYFMDRDFGDLVLSAKTHSVSETICVNRELSRILKRIPLHIGVTEAGSLMQGSIKNSCALSVLLAEGIGDTIRVSLTADPIHEVEVGWQILSALGIRRRGVEIISCPTCSRTKVDLFALEEKVREALKGFAKPISVAVMGCVVNGPGEARSADIGVAAGLHEGLIFEHGEIVEKVPEEKIVEALLSRIENL